MQAREAREDLALQLRQIAHRAAVGRGGQRGVGLQGLRNVALAVHRLPGSVALGFHGGAAGCQFGVGDAQVDGAVGDVCLLYTSPSPRDRTRSRMPSSA